LDRITVNTEKKDLLKLVNPCRCESCTVGCRYGSGVFADGEIEKLAGFLGISKERLEKDYLESVTKFNKKKFRPKILRIDKPYGKCIFFDEKVGCKIHEAKPLECKISMGCKSYGQELSLWLMLNQFVDKDDAESIRQYASYLKSGGKTLEGAELEDLVPDKEKLKKILEYKIH
jgi:hypothetical protein